MEVLETRDLMVGAAIGGALGLPGVSVNDFSQPNAIGIATDITADGFLGFSTGSDDKYVILSTGDATRISTPAGYPTTGTDWSSKGAVADDVTVIINAPVPAGARRLKLDFMFLTQETPGATNVYNDSFKVIANAGMGAGDETLVDYTVNNAPYNAAVSVDGTIFKRRTYLLTMNYQVPVGASNVRLQLTLLDEHDGKGDTAVLLDNLRFEQGANLVYLNFEGGTSQLFGPGTSLAQPAFQAADLNSTQDRAALISSIVSTVEQNFANFDVSFVTTLPATTHATVLIGGDNTSTVTLNTNPANGPLPNPLYVTRLGGSTGTYLQAAGFLPTVAVNGQAPKVDLNNSVVDETVVVFSQEYAQNAPAATDTQLIARIASTISHELGHALGLRHIDDSFKSNIMSQFAPRNLNATFENIDRALAESWPDGATTQNDTTYLNTILGPAFGSFVWLCTSTREYMKFVLATIPFVNLYKAYLSVIPGQPLESDVELEAAPETISLGDLSGTELLQIPNYGPGTRVLLYGQSTPNGPIDIFSGVPDANGDLDLSDSAVPLFGPDGEISLNIPLAQGTPGSLVALADGIGLKASQFTTKLLPFGTYQDTQGDSYTIKLTSKTGVGGFTMVDPDGDGKGPIDQIVLQDTTIKDKLAITVKKPTKAQLAAGLDGRVDIGSIKGSTLGSIDAKSSDLTGAGVEFGNLLGSLAVRDVLNGADISIGGGETVKTKITARVVGDGTDIVSRSTISALTAVAIGEGKIDAPAIGTLKVTGDKTAAISGDFRSDISLAHSTPFLTLAMIKKSLLGSATIAGIVEGATIDVDGPVGTFRAARFVNSILDVASFFLPAKLGSFTASGIKGSPLASFDNSTIVANIIGSVNLGTIDTDNGGVPFGVIATDSFGTVTGTLLPVGTKFKFDKKNPAAQGSGDFVVKLDFGL